jgi:hypothetical protein
MGVRGINLVDSDEVVGMQLDVQGEYLLVASEKGMGMENTTLWLDGMQFPFQIVVAEQILGAIEVYASKCYDNTQKHLFQVQNLNSVDELVRFDITEGFPEKLSFSM